MFITGPDVVRTVIGEEVSLEDLGLRLLQRRDSAGVLAALHAAPSLFEFAAVPAAPLKHYALGSRCQPSFRDPGRESMLTSALRPPYSAWKWGGLWSS